MGLQPLKNCFFRLVLIVSGIGVVWGGELCGLIGGRVLATSPQAHI